MYVRTSAMTSAELFFKLCWFAGTPPRLASIVRPYSRLPVFPLRPLALSVLLQHGGMVLLFASYKIGS